MQNTYFRIARSNKTLWGNFPARNSHHARATKQTTTHTASNESTEYKYFTVQPPYNRNMCFYIAPIIKLLKMVTLCIFHYCASSTFYTFTSYCTYHRQYSPPQRKHGIRLHQNTAPEQKTTALRL